MPPTARDPQPDVRHRQDLHLTRAAVDGDEDARRQVAQRLHQRVAATVRYLRGDQSDTPDLVQICLVELLRSLDGFRGESLLETWADRIAVRTTMRELRREQNRRQTMTTEYAEESHYSVEDPERRLGREELMCRVTSMLQKLTPDRRLVMVLRAVHGYTMPEIAALTDSHLHNVQNDYRAARKQLRRLVETDALLREWARGRRS